MIDEKSLEILKILQEKARIPNVEVSRQVNLAPSAVLERVRKLEKQGIIDGYEVRLNPKKFACSQIAFIHIKLQGKYKNPGLVGKKLAAVEEVQEVHFIAGEDGYLVKVRTTDTATLGKLLREKISSIDGVEETKTSTVLHTYKETAKILIRI